MTMKFDCSICGKPIIANVCYYDQNTKKKTCYDCYLKDAEKKKYFYK